MAKGGVGAFYRASPNPGDHGELFTQVLGQIRALSDHFGSNFDLRVEVADTLFGLLAHPGAVTAHVLGQSLGARPVLEGVTGSALLAALVGSNLRPNRRSAGKLGRNLDHRLVDGHCHRVEVGGVAFQP
ncbi:hypothetical protein B479_23110 [Pseudomonas putida HB3267]|nr:hypothetical protein B479_23110 [Pseudomonas putida HB3267]